MTTTPNGAVAQAFEELERGVRAALETYSNVHRGSGHNSLVSTRLFEQAREIVLEHLGLNSGTYEVVFCSPRRAVALEAQLKPGSYTSVSSQDIGLPLGVRAVAVKMRALPKALRSETGGGTARLVSADWVIWAKAPDRLEAGTPAIINVIAFAKALRLTRELGIEAFDDSTAEELSAAEIVRRDEFDQLSGRELLEALRRTLVGSDVRVPTAQGESPFVNLDNGASTPTFEPIWKAVRQTWRQPERVQSAVVEEVKSVCAEVLGAPSADYDVIFTSNTTEAINLVAESLGNRADDGTDPVVLNTLLEHNSNELPWRTVPGATLIRLSIDDEGFVDLGELATLLREYNQDGEHGAQRIRLVTVSGASNVLGVYNDLAQIGQVAHQYGAQLLVDAAQLVAHRAVSMQDCGIDYLAFSAHKAYAPFGTGALVARRGLLNFGGEGVAAIQSSGEENVAGIAALGKALVLLQRIGLDVIQAEEQALTARALLGMSRVPGLTVYGVCDPETPAFARKGGVIPFALKGTISHSVARQLAERGGIGVRSGCHCAHLTVKRMLGIPPWAQRIQGVIVTVLPRVELPGVARVSLGIENSAQDVDALIAALQSIAQQPKGCPENIKQQIDGFAETAARRVYLQGT
jgi:selenocysteine lyase/cysteine desulfurase